VTRRIVSADFWRRVPTASTALGKVSTAVVSGYRKVTLPQKRRRHPGAGQPFGIQDANPII
jgi:hypothetical protein